MKYSTTIPESGRGTGEEKEAEVVGGDADVRHLPVREEQLGCPGLGNCLKLPSFTNRSLLISLPPH